MSNTPTSTKSFEPCADSLFRSRDPTYRTLFAGVLSKVRPNLSYHRYLRASQLYGNESAILAAEKAGHLSRWLSQYAAVSNTYYQRALLEGYEHPWKGAINDIADWIIDEPDVKFETLLQHESNIKVIHVVPYFKKAAVIAQRDRLMEQSGLPQEAHPTIHTCSYLEFVETLKSVRDPDFGAAFALALMTSTTFATSVFSQTNGLTRLITLSWERLHEAAHVLFSLWREPRQFTLPELDRGQPNTISIAADEDSLASTVARVDQETGGKHIVLSFHRPHPEIEGWEVQECRRGCSPIGEVRPPLVDKYMLYIEDLSSAPSCISGFDSVRIVTNENFIWEVFGDIVKQVTRRFLAGDLPLRPMAVLSGQAGGFLAAPADLSHWPRSITTLPRVMKQLYPVGRIINGVTGRMVFQGLFEFNDSALGVDIKLPEPARRALHEILPLSSTTRFISLAKARTAAMLTHGVHAFNVDVDELNDTTYAVMCRVAKECIFGLFSNHGQAFKALGLTKNTKQMMGAGEMISYADGSFMVDAGIGQEVETNCADLLHALTATLGPVPLGHQVSTMTSDVFDEICYDLAKAFQFQAAIVEFPEGQLPEMKDFASQQPLDYSLEVHSSVTWDTIRYINSAWVAGIYTKLERSEDGKLTILDWNWIPRRVWSRLRAEFYQGYHGGSQNNP
ncbi:hypothetical protein NM208_g12899 [Fusarium decemcellulare]|uniref:Uncharacterized protein n=1 Tax=Fusarium decemcellulare TaxID=57161 RepID=A0ACC1RNQ4_9HYPO|nr:hypothetical protein NM208_g12899 [Fusarium decemcellulare]